MHTLDYNCTTITTIAALSSPRSEAVHLPVLPDLPELPQPLVFHLQKQPWRTLPLFQSQISGPAFSVGREEGFKFHSFFPTSRISIADLTLTMPIPLKTGFATARNPTMPYLASPAHSDLSFLQLTAAYCLPQS